MVKISHETPICLLKESKRFNDYQYALVHLLENNKEYRNHFLECKDENIPIYLDNSLHELGTAIGGEILLKWIHILKPQYIFVPDVWEDKTASIVNAREWAQYELPEETTKIAIVQAKSLSEAIECTMIYKDLGYKKIAYSYGASFYNDIVKHPNQYIGKALGRVSMISHFCKIGLLTPTDKIHLLGTACPIEFAFYKDIKCIDSIDTSNPIMLTLDKKEYNDTFTNDKPISNMNNSINIDYSKIDLDLLEENITKFKNLFND